MLRRIRQDGEKDHENCHRIVLLVRPGDSYEPPPYVEQWEQDCADGVKEARGDGKTNGEYGAAFKETYRRMDKDAALRSRRPGLKRVRPRNRRRPAN